MQLKDYIQGKRHGKEANRLERNALSDHFLQDALDGFDEVSGDHSKIIEKLEKKFSSKTSKIRYLYLYWSAAASVILLIGLGIFFFLTQNETETPIIAMNQPIEYEKVVPSMDTSIISEKNMEIKKDMIAAVRLPEIKKISTIYSELLDALDDTENYYENINFAVLEIEEEYLISLEEESKTLEFQTLSDFHSDEVVVTAMLKSDRRKLSESSPVARKEAEFGEKEFQDLCKQNIETKICAEKKITVKLTFFIDETGKPTEIKFINYSCEEVKIEIEKLLSSSPIWTKKKRKVTLNIVIGD